MDGINTWWKDRSAERFWLGVTGRDDDGDVLAAPLGSRHEMPSWTHPLIAHVRRGDIVFHFDEPRRAIVAWSTSTGRVRKRQLLWSNAEPSRDPRMNAPRLLPSWSVALDPPTPLDIVVPLDYIARVQWEMFPALRTFEDEVGAPLYYPFSMGSPSEAGLLPGYVFKLPAMFVENFPALAIADSPRAAARSTRAASQARARSSAPAAPGHGEGRGMPSAPQPARLLTR